MMLSVSMIVKNESSCIERCLESVKDADEIVIIDTGSIDNTIELCKKYTDKVYSGPEYLWRDDFSFSRNQSLEKCTGDWVLIIDADETLESNGVAKIRDLIKDRSDEVIYFDTICKTTNAVHKSVRLFKKKPDIIWCGKIHNYLNVTRGYDSGIKLYYGYSDAHKLDPDRSLRILSSVVKDNINCSREKFYLAREYYYKSDWIVAIYYYDYYLQTATWGPEIAEAWLQKAKCYINLKDTKKARICCLRAININADFKEAFVIMSKLTGPKNSKKWLELSKYCNNSDVLFIR